MQRCAQKGEDFGVAEGLDEYNGACCGGDGGVLTQEGTRPRLTSVRGIRGSARGNWTWLDHPRDDNFSEPDVPTGAGDQGAASHFNVPSAAFKHY